MKKIRKKLISVDFLNIENGKHLSRFEVSIRERMLTCRNWDALFFWIDMDEALSTLTERQRLCFSLKHIDGYSETEISSMFRLSQPTVFQHIQSGKKKLRNFLSDGYKNP